VRWCVAVRATVHANTVLPNDFFSPPNTVAIGDPVVIYTPDQKDAMTKAIRSLGFAKVAFNVDIQEKFRVEIYREVTEVRSKEFMHHMDDSIISDRGDGG
jgi:hypothetical protein